MSVVVRKNLPLGFSERRIRPGLLDRTWRAGTCGTSPLCTDLRVGLFLSNVAVCEAVPAGGCWPLGRGSVLASAGKGKKLGYGEAV